jgi:uncharacterized SAM-binding protein YcdF (DUF218 family)
MRFLLSLLMFGILLWASLLAWFVMTMPRDAVPVDHKAEALVVLTGGSGRVEHGLSMLAAGAAPVLFISGVGEQVTEEEILTAHADAATRERIYESGGEVVLDHIARSTVSNADQTAEFLRARNIKTIRLITADYHMRRSLREFRGAMPNLEVVPDPVFPEGFRRNEWWQHENTRRLVFSEFYKYLAVLVRDALKP